MKKKILFITGSRADYGLLKPVIQTALLSRKLDPLLLVTGMHTLELYGLSQRDIRADGFKIDSYIKISPNKDMIGWLNEEISGIKEYCLRTTPDIILVLGDRDEALAGAIVGSHLGISVAHIHGGDITGPVTVDDKIRDVITSFSDTHFPINQKSASRISQILGPKKQKKIFIIGSLASEQIKDNLLSKKEIYAKYRLSPKLPLILIVLHPTPLSYISYENQLNPVIKALKQFKTNLILIYPNSDTGSDVFIKEIKSQKIFIHQFQTIKRELYLSLLASCDVLVGNSSSGPLEAPFFSTRVVNIGKRQQGRSNYRNMISVGYDYDKIRRAIASQLLQKKKKRINLFKGNKPSRIIVSCLEKLLYHEK